MHRRRMHRQAVDCRRVSSAFPRNTAPNPGSGSRSVAAVATSSTSIFLPALPRRLPRRRERGLGTVPENRSGISCTVFPIRYFLARGELWVSHGMTCSDD